MKEAKPDYAQGEAAVAARAIADSGGWEPFVDWSSTCPGNRGVNREGRYELYDAPIGIAITIHQDHFPVGSTCLNLALASHRHSRCQL
tara:strand:- start:41 stop:304 length:264 start_codon:yes stop_codon:yes gene_type:complete